MISQAAACGLVDNEKDDFKYTLSFGEDVFGGPAGAT